jgi:hypothetical protein
MGFLKKLFGAAKPPEPDCEVVERQVSLDLPKNTAWAKLRGKKEILVSELLKGKDQSFSRFYLSFDDSAKTHFAPSLRQAIDWFRGRTSPGDGYGNIFWGEHVVYQCDLCKDSRKFDLTINRVEKVVLSINFPAYREITGWRVIEVNHEILGRGMPTKFMRLHETVPVIHWQHGKQLYLCRGCSQKLIELGRERELSEYAIFD